MKKGIIALLSIIILSCSGCVGDKVDRINTTAAKDLESDLFSYKLSIKKVDILYYEAGSRYQHLEINVYISNSPSEDSINTILERVKKYASSDTDTVADSEAEVNLNIYTSGKIRMPSIVYSSYYYNSNDHTDNSPENINRYKVWYKDT